MMPATRQNGGRFEIELVEPGTVKLPPVTASAAVTVVSGSFSVPSPAQAASFGVCAWSVVATPSAARIGVRQ